MRHLEDDMAMSVATYLKLQYPKVLFTHSPNGGKRNAREGARFKRMGVKRGMVDFLIFDSNNPHIRGVAIELKVKPNKCTPEQVEVIEQFKTLKWAAYVCYSYDEAQQVIDKHLK